ncbi:hypothetical protein THAOC_33640, partial [Thalassiosira oceanica]
PDPIEEDEGGLSAGGRGWKHANLDAGRGTPQRSAARVDLPPGDPLVPPRDLAGSGLRRAREDARREGGRTAGTGRGVPRWCRRRASTRGSEPRGAEGRRGQRRLDQVEQGDVQSPGTNAAAEPSARL